MVTRFVRAANIVLALLVRSEYVSEYCGMPGPGLGYYGAECSLVDAYRSRTETSPRPSPTGDARN